jgi:YebC/PmpR family DNA-binding regulatory protein
MSGHSKWATIKHQKGINDAKRGNLFSKLARAITVAAKVGGAIPETNLKLKIAIDRAREASMPKDNIERAIEKGSGAGGGDMQEAIYEGYAPGGIAILIEAATDNKNRTTQEIKSIFSRAEGSLASPGAVAFQFEHKGLMVIGGSGEETILNIMEVEGVEDVIEVEGKIEVYTQASELMKVKEQIEKLGMIVSSAELTFKPKNIMEVDPGKFERIIKLIEMLDDLDDVQKVYANLA